MKISANTDLKEIQALMGEGYTLGEAKEMREVLIANGIEDTDKASRNTIRDCVTMAVSGPGPAIGDEHAYEHEPRDEPAVFFGVREYPQFVKADALTNGEKKRFVVIDEDKFGIIDPRQPNGVVLLSSPASHYYAKPVNNQGLRPAVFEDFEKFRVSTGGYDSDATFDFPHPKEVEFYLHCNGHSAVAKMPRTEYLRHANEIAIGFRDTVMPNEVDLLRNLTPVDSFKLNKQQSHQGVFWHREVVEGEPHFTILPMQDSTPEQISLTEKQLRTYHGDCATSSVLQPKHWVSPQQVEQIAAAKNRQDQIKQADSALAFVVDAIAKSPSTPATSRDL